MQEEHITLRSRIPFHGRKWLTPESPKGVVLFVHGWGDHCGRYANVAKSLNGLGISAYGFDFEGHGETPGLRAYIDDFATLVSDLAVFIAYVKNECPEAPLYVCGYSMGGCVAATYIVSEPAHGLAGVIFCASALQTSKDISPLKIFAARVLGDLWPKLRLANLTAGHLMSRDTSEVEKYEDDQSIYHGKITARTGKQLLLANDRIGQKLNKIDLPLLVLQGSRDELVSPEGGRAVYEQATSQDKKLEVYEGAFHDLFHEVNREEVIGDLCNWLSARI